MINYQILWNFKQNITFVIHSWFVLTIIEFDFNNDVIVEPRKNNTFGLKEIMKKCLALDVYYQFVFFYRVSWAT